MKSRVTIIEYGLMATLIVAAAIIGANLSNIAGNL